MTGDDEERKIQQHPQPKIETPPKIEAPVKPHKYAHVYLGLRRYKKQKY